jgi:hypothetical protein
MELTPSMKGLAIDRRRLRTSQWAFALFWVSCFLPIVSLFVALLTAPDEPPPTRPPATISREIFALVRLAEVTPKLLLLGSGGVLALSAAATLRWRWAAWGLLATLVGQALAAAISVATLGPSYSAEIGQPFFSRLAVDAMHVLMVLEFWWMAVILAEFALVCKETILLQQTEYLGYGILSALGAMLAYVGWSLPVAIPSDDDVTIFLEAAAVLLQLMVLVWILQPLSRANSLAVDLQKRLDADSAPSA